MTAGERLAAAVEAVPELRGGRPVERLGGITNVNVKVESPMGMFVVRIEAADEDVLEIDRATERPTAGPPHWPAWVHLWSRGCRRNASSSPAS